MPEPDLLDDTNEESVDIVVQLPAHLHILDSVSPGQTPSLCGNISSNSQLSNFPVFLTLDWDLSAPDQVRLVAHQYEGEGPGEAALPQFVQDQLGLLQAGPVSQAEHHHDTLLLSSRVRVLGQVTTSQGHKVAIVFKINYQVSHCHTVFFVSVTVQ